MHTINQSSSDYQISHPIGVGGGMVFNRDSHHDYRRYWAAEQAISNNDNNVDEDDDDVRFSAKSRFWSDGAG